jgi:hypothetical protein
VVKFIEEQKAQKPPVRLGELVERIKEQFGIQVHLRSIQRAVKRKEKKPLKGARTGRKPKATIVVSSSLARPETLKKQKGQGLSVKLTALGPT